MVNWLQTSYSAHTWMQKFVVTLRLLCSLNLSARIPLQGENLYGGGELVDLRLPLGFGEWVEYGLWKGTINAQRFVRKQSLLRYRDAQNLRRIGGTEFLQTSSLCCQPRCYSSYALTYATWIGICPRACLSMYVNCSGFKMDAISGDMRT